MYPGNVLQKVVTLNCSRTLCAMLLRTWLGQSRAWARGLNRIWNLGGCWRVLQERLRVSLDVLVLDTGNETIDLPLNLDNTPASYQHVRVFLQKMLIDALTMGHDGVVLLSGLLPKYSLVSILHILSPVSHSR